MNSTKLTRIRKHIGNLNNAELIILLVQNNKNHIMNISTSNHGLCSKNGVINTRNLLTAKIGNQIITSTHHITENLGKSRSNLLGKLTRNNMNCVTTKHNYQFLSFCLFFILIKEESSDKHKSYKDHCYISYIRNIFTQTRYTLA